ncbi:MAG: hypothetical protein Q8N77_00465 [Nanoarchaeota archaeon]|nr:hypothetical protein [Nanoarchaeota archaeon]
MKVPQMFLPETRSDEKLEKLLAQDRISVPDSGEPKAGQYVYVHTPNAPLFSKDMCKIIEVKEEIRDGKKELFVEVEKMPGCYFNWAYLSENQERWRKIYSDEVTAGQ